MTHGNSKYSTELASRIVEHIANGETLADFCRQNDIGYTTVMDWQRDNEEFSEDIARAREIGHDVIAERLRDVARGGIGSSQDVSRDKLIVDTDLKLLAKWSKKYADKVHNDITVTEGLTKEQRDAAVAAAVDAKG